VSTNIKLKTKPKLFIGVGTLQIVVENVIMYVSILLKNFVANPIFFIAFSAYQA